MKKTTAIAMFTLLIPLASSFTEINFTENFEDDTVGANPTDDYYTFLESTSSGGVVSTDRAKSVPNSLLVRTEGDGAALNYGANQDWCTSDEGISYWYSPTAGGGVSANFAISAGEPTGDFDDADDIPFPWVGIQYFGDGRVRTEWREDTGPVQGAGSYFTTSASNPNWYRVEITRVGDCDGSFSFTAEIFNEAEVSLGSQTSTCDPCNFASEVSTLIWIDVFDGGTGSPNTYVDDIDFGTIIVPDAPTGVASTVTNNEVTPDEFNVRFTLSPDDTNQVAGAYTYTLYYDSGSGTTVYDTYPPGTAVDGVIADEVLISATASVTFWATATDPSTGLESVDSCTVTVDSTIIDDSDSCGVSIPGEEVTGGDLTGPNGGLFGGDRSALADALQISEASLQLLIGVLLLMLLIAGGWFTYGMVGAAGLGLIGLVMNYALGLFPFWTLYVMAFIGIAVGILLLKMRGVASG